MKAKKKRFILAKLYDAKGDISKEWFVYYSFTNPETGHKKRFRIYEDINSYKTKRERRAKAKVVIDAINDVLQAGWSPFGNHEGQISIKDELGKLIRRKKLELGERTSSTYESIANIFIEWLTEAEIDHFALREFQKEHADAFLLWTKEVRKVANRTRNNYRNYLVTFWNEMGAEDANPFKETR